MLVHICKCEEELGSYQEFFATRRVMDGTSVFFSMGVSIAWAAVISVPKGSNVALVS